MGFLGFLKPNVVFRDSEIPSIMANGGVPKFLHPCESATSTSDGYNFPIRTPICTFLDSTESSLSQKFNIMK